MYVIGGAPLAHSKSFADAFVKERCGNSRQLYYVTPRSTNLHMFSGVQAELLQFNLVSCKNWEKMNTLHIYGSKLY